MFLTAAPLVQAQDAASTPFRHRSPAKTEESPSPVTTPEPTETLTLQPIPVPTLEPLGSPLPKPSEAIFLSTPRPIATPTPAPVLAESPASDDPSDIASKIKALEQRWEASYVTHDVSVIEELVADDFVGTSSSGKVGNKATMIAQVRQDKNVYTSAVSEDLVVRVFAPNLAVVTGVARETGKTAGGKAFSQAFRFTDTWMERDGRWQCIAAQAMALPKK